MATTLLVNTPVLAAVITRLQDAAEGLNAHFEAQMIDASVAEEAEGLAQYGAYPVEWETSLAVGVPWGDVVVNSDGAQLPIVTVSLLPPGDTEDPRSPGARFQGTVNVVVEHAFGAVEGIPADDTARRQALAASLVVDAMLGVFDPANAIDWEPAGARMGAQISPSPTVERIGEGDGSLLFYVTTTVLHFEVNKR